MKESAPWRYLDSGSRSNGSRNNLTQPLCDVILSPLSHSVQSRSRFITSVHADSNSPLTPWCFIPHGVNATTSPPSLARSVFLFRPVPCLYWGSYTSLNSSPWTVFIVWDGLQFRTETFLCFPQSFQAIHDSTWIEPRQVTFVERLRIGIRLPAGANKSPPPMTSLLLVLTQPPI